MFAEGIVVGGEALIDVVRSPGGYVGSHPGGGPYNTARTLGRLGRDVAYLGLLSRDEEGSRLRAGLREDGVETSPALDTDLPTTMAEASLDGEGVASYRFASEGTSAAALTPDAALAAVGPAVRMLHIGSLGLVFEPTASALRAVAARLAGSALVTVDVNCRPSAIGDAAAYRAGLGEALGCADVVKASTEDLEWLAPRSQPLVAARELLGRGPRVVLLTDGPRGATVVTGEGDRAVPAAVVEHVADTVGAGDAFGGAFLAWWDNRGLGADALTEGDRLEEATRFACLVAARTCMRPGAWPPTLAELGGGAL